MNLIEWAVVGVCRVLLWISTSVIFIILVANTVLRYATGTSLQWANEAVSYTHLTLPTICSV